MGYIIGSEASAWWLAPLVVVATIFEAARNKWRARQGLDQWPDPHGPLYDEWLGLPYGSGDYYDWLARRFMNQQPWRAWAARDRQRSDMDNHEVT